MKRALVLSDSHGLTREVKQVVNKVASNDIFHCGDFCVDEHKAPFQKMKRVKGNNDYMSEAPYEATFEWLGITIFMTHGHKYGVNTSLLQLKYKALQVGAKIVLFGHTHFPLCVEEDGIIFINPGSLKKPRGFRIPTYVVLLADKKSNNLTIHVNFYDLNHHEVKELSQSFVSTQKT